MLGVPAEAKYLNALACYKAAFVACSLVFISMVVSSWYRGDYKYVFGKVGKKHNLDDLCHLTVPQVMDHALYTSNNVVMQVYASVSR